MTDDDALLRQLAARVRDDGPRDELPDGAPAFDAAAEDRIVSRLLRQAAPAGKAQLVEAPKPIKRRTPWVFAAPALLAAAAAALIAVSTQSSGDLPPEYELRFVSVTEQRSPERAAPNAEIVLDPDGELDLVARPLSRAGDIRARALLVRNGAAALWRAPLERSDDGALRITGSNRRLFPDPSGRYEVVLFLAHEAALPSESEALRLALAPAPAGSALRVLRARVRFLEKR